MHDRYVFEYPVTFRHPDNSTSPGRIDLYKRGCFVLEAKQGADAKLDELPLFVTGGRRKTGVGTRNTKGWALAMQGARGQAERYAKALPTEHGWPPFLIVVDVGHCIELYADFSRSGKAYSQFPDAQGFRIKLEDLPDPAVRELLRAVWTEPMALDPAARAEQVTREVSAKLAVVARALEAQGHHPETVAGFLMRCMFSMFAEDVGLLPKDCFSKLLEGMCGRPDGQFTAALEQFWADMDKGNPYSAYAGDAILRFNGGLFAERRALPLDGMHLGLLIEAAKADWRDVEPAIFGTFLEQALDARERKKLGAEFTPRRWVERLVMPAVIEPLREEWGTVKAAAVNHDFVGERDKAVAAVRAFHRHLCALRILDPACGSGNFLYVTMEHLKRLEGEVLDVLVSELGQAQDDLELERFTVDPHQFLGIEVNPRAAHIAEVVLWIGYLQWHFKTRGRVMPAQPVLKNFHNIECRDALLEWDSIELVRDAAGKPVTHWDGRTMTTDLVTGREVPDPAASVPVERYLKPRPAPWPEADYIVGNPPFTGGKDLRDRLGGFAEALWKAYPDVPKSADLVMYWWKRAADLVRTGKAKRFGLITTNSLPQTFNRRVVAAALDAKPRLSLAFAVPDHPWYVEAGMAAVRIAMTVGVAGPAEGRLYRVVDPQRRAADGGDALRPGVAGKLRANLTIGADLDKALELRANERISNRGVVLHGSGFIVSMERAQELGLGIVPSLEKHIREYRHGKDLTQRPRGLMVIDLFGLSEADVRRRFPAVFQHVTQTVKPERDRNRRPVRRKNWWLFGEPISTFRPALADLPRYIATVETAKHRVFQFLDGSILPDNKLINIAVEDPAALGVLSSHIHVTWALAAGARLGVGNDPVYVKTRCFDPFPFPDASDAQRRRIGGLADELDALRKRVLAEHEILTLTKLYNVREALKEGRALSAAEREIFELGCVGVIASLHDEIDAAVAEAYGWPVDLADEAVLERLVALNIERRAEEARGLVRWLRPDYQTPAGKVVELDRQGMLAVTSLSVAAKAQKPKWPKGVPERIKAVRVLLAEQRAPLSVEELAAGFSGRKQVDDVADAVRALAGVGLANHVGDGRYAP